MPSVGTWRQSREHLLWARMEGCSDSVQGSIKEILKVLDRRKEECDERKVNARQRWRILAKAIKWRFPSVPRFGGFDLVSIRQIALEHPENWNEYKIILGTGYTVNVHRMRPKITAKDLMGFNNTGNICLWPSEEALSYYILENLKDFQDKWVLELGGGMTCLAGLLVAKYGNPYGVHLTDGNNISVDNVRRSLRLNPINCYIKCSNLPWERSRELHPGDESKFDYIFSADCVFFDESRSALVDAIQFFLALEGTALVIAPKRGQTLDLFASEASARGLKCRPMRKYSDIVWMKHLELTMTAQYCEDMHYPILVLVTKI
ncbi:calmodulin-lysine N-methyltransferase [Phlebotomus argentipes]|uniref:calmodulin-lysine N-methyltransferase n=1 Tax=Phlebotomus argentipes TaxID=94469 RepID=UPI0028934FFC|nr:calmodulin-lysine N-methyltransferase [Phlebotomus argentipes]